MLSKAWIILAIVAVSIEAQTVTNEVPIENVEYEEEKSIIEDVGINNLAKEVLEDESAIEKFEETHRKANTDLNQEDYVNLQNSEENKSTNEDVIIDYLAKEVLNDESAIEKLEETSRKSKADFNQEDLLNILNSEAVLNSKLPVNRLIAEFHNRGIDLDQDIDRKDVENTSEEPGIRCIPKVIQIEETVYDRGMKCNHSFEEKCHLTYITDYKSSTQKKCDTSFKKNCHITFRPMSTEEKVKICHVPLVRQCGGTTTGPPICSTEYEDVCETVFKSYDIEQDHPNCKIENEVRCRNSTLDNSFSAHIAAGENTAPIVREQCEQWPVQKCTLEKKNVHKVHPDTSCKKIPRQVCIPNNCNMVKGPEVCKDEKRAQIQNVPEEECDLQPEEQCRLESVLVPRLIPKPNCIKVPKEICVNTRKNPRRVQKPVIKEWCYNTNDLNA